MLITYPKPQEGTLECWDLELNELPAQRTEKWHLQESDCTSAPSLVLLNLFTVDQEAKFHSKLSTQSTGSQMHIRKACRY